MAIRQRFGDFALVACIATSALALCVSFATSADTVCKKPNPNEKFCRTLGKYAIGDCNDKDGVSYNWCHAEICMDRKQFPDGDANNATGTVKDQLADCWRTAECIWDADTRKCNMPTTWGPYQKEDKVVVGTNPCPGS